MTGAWLIAALALWSHAAPAPAPTPALLDCGDRVDPDSAPDESAKRAAKWNNQLRGYCLKMNNSINRSEQAPGGDQRAMDDYAENMTLAQGLIEKVRSEPTSMEKQAFLIKADDLIIRSSNRWGAPAKTEAKKLADPAPSGGAAGDPAASLARTADLEKKADVILPTNPEMRVDLAKSYIGLGQPADAERNASKAIFLAPMLPDGWALRSAARVQQGNLPGAASDAQRTLALDPQNKLAQTVQSFVNDSSKDLTRHPKLPDLRSLLSAGPVRAGAVRPSDSGKPLHGADLAEGASTALLLRGGPTRPAPDTPSQRLVAEASTKLKLKDKTGALLAATRAIEADPKNPDAWAARAEASNKLGNYAGAIKDAKQALELDPGNAKALRERSFANYNVGKYQEAFDDADKAVKLEPSNALGYLYRAMAREKLGDIPGALKDYETAASLDVSLKPFYEDAMSRHGGGPNMAAPTALRGRGLGLLVLAAAGVLGLLALAAKRRRGGVTTAARWLSGFGAYHGTGGAAANPRSGTLPPGTLLGSGFRIAGELGRGGMGIVYDATDTKLDRRVAIKQLRRELASSDDLDRFLREAKLAAQLKHPNIVSVLTVVERDDEAFLVFEYVDGQTLDKRLEASGPLGLKEAGLVLADVCGALGYAHDRRIIHRDLKPSNILIDTGGRARIMDFGIAHQAKTVSKATSTAPWGTPAYMAPEQGMGRVSPASDLFALGVTAYELLTGRLPYAGAAEDKLNKIYAPPSKFGLPGSADAFFDQALEPDPARRFESAVRFLESFQRLG
jgi:tetratricopeptide (TPR) repeat protein